MKLLLTSAGLSNKSISDALVSLLEKPFSETKIGFIPTAANIERGDKSWFIKDLEKLRSLNFKSIDIIDISALPEEEWKKGLSDCDVLYFEGGNTCYLMEWILRSGINNFFEDWLKTKIYVGVSAGSIVAGKEISTSRDWNKDKKIMV